MAGFLLRTASVLHHDGDCDKEEQGYLDDLWKTVKIYENVCAP